LNGDEPFAYNFTPTHRSDHLQRDFKHLENGQEASEEIEVSIAGRIIASRFMGKLAFLNLLDEHGTIQVN